MNNDLISRKALLEILRPLNDEPEDMMSDEYFEWDNMCSDDMLNKVLETVEAFPAVDAEPVRHGEWILNPCNLYNDATWVCSVCGNEWVLIDGTPLDNQMDYCTKCGALMNGGTDGDNKQ